ncbi:anti-sigma factor [Winogradskyella maritima]|uniref:Regulator of SigK n=1 Tax=Winogradskyella maritima TaxID=1517766 RepID=A0ABV8AJP9_9FLAO|nr:anti-sigma factor [Winogradskyella maritima]
MIDKKRILDEGLLEQYALGHLNDKDQAQIEFAITNDAELKNALDEIEETIELVALENTQEPPKSIKDQLLQSTSTKETKVVSIAPNPNNTYKTYLGIAVALATFLMLSNFWMYSEMQEANQNIEVVNEQNNQLIQDLKSLESQFEENNKWMAVLSDPNAETYVLKGNDTAPTAEIVSYINHDKKSVVINAKTLPELDDEHDYQMWADVDGVMIDMGIIPKGEKLIAMTYIENSESLNVTIEPAGGNDHPTVERLITNVYLK